MHPLAALATPRVLPLSHSKITKFTRSSHHGPTGGADPRLTLRQNVEHVWEIISGDHDLRTQGCEHFLVPLGARLTY